MGAPAPTLDSQIEEIPQPIKVEIPTPIEVEVTPVKIEETQPEVKE